MSPISFALSPPAAHATASRTQEASESREEYALFGIPRLQEAFRSTRVTFVSVVSDFRSVKEEIRSLSNLREGWDTYGGLPTSADAVLQASLLIDGLRERQLDGSIRSGLPYHVSPLATGGMQLEWRNGQDALEIEIDNAGRMSALFDRSNSVPRFEEHEDMSTADVLQAITSFLSV